MPGRRDDLQLKVLGEFEARMDDAPLPLGGRQQRALLLTLALEPGRSVPVPRLVDRLWGEQPPASAVGTLHAYLSRLRAVLPDPGRTLVTTASGYVLDVDPQQVDCVVFENLAGRGRASLAAGRFADAARDLRASLDLWRGPCLPEFATHAAGQGAIDRLEGLRALTREDLLEADLARGLHHECVAPSRGPVAGTATAGTRLGRPWPWPCTGVVGRPRPWRRCGPCGGCSPRSSAWTPRRRLRRLEHLVLTQDASLDLPESLPVTVAAAPPASPPPAETPSPARSEVGLVGRDAELDTLRSLLASATATPGGARVAVVEGEAGVGKTTLVRRCVSEAGRHGILPVWVSCTGATGGPALWPWIKALRDLDARLGGLSRFGVTAVSALLSEDAVNLVEDGDPHGFGVPRGRRRAPDAAGRGAAAFCSSSTTCTWPTARPWRSWRTWHPGSGHCACSWWRSTVADQGSR